MSDAALAALARQAQCSRDADASKDELPAVGGNSAIAAPFWRRPSLTTDGSMRTFPSILNAPVFAAAAHKFPPAPSRTEFRDKKAGRGRLGISVESGQ